jgi:hypothetical protein
MGNEVEYPRASVVPIEDIRTAIKKFLETGERPTGVERRTQV